MLIKNSKVILISSISYWATSNWLTTIPIIKMSMLLAFIFVHWIGNLKVKVKIITVRQCFQTNENDGFANEFQGQINIKDNTGTSSIKYKTSRNSCQIYLKIRRVLWRKLWLMKYISTYDNFHKYMFTSKNFVFMY